MRSTLLYDSNEHLLTDYSLIEFDYNVKIDIIILYESSCKSFIAYNFR